ncbi:hypothetical protein RSSM_06692 [Rhodopirellula sallentina SM41]|uniref:Uncharacterized protein n=1 Tax=Rhodopirellula sallentina SM41 TaxID=1263870 RepID=M5U7E9_9BACT|nr:hypothetical protein RSSM_06692 [Rhodopirellula sallentina SM41]
MELDRPLQTMRGIIRPSDIDRIGIELSNLSEPTKRPRSNEEWKGLYIIGNTETDPHQPMDGDQLLRWLKKTEAALPAGKATLMSIKFTDSLVDWLIRQQEITQLIALDAVIEANQQQLLTDRLQSLGTSLTESE